MLILCGKYLFQRYLLVKRLREICILVKFKKGRENVRLIYQNITKLYFEKLKVFIKNVKITLQSYSFLQIKSDVPLINQLLLPYMNLVFVAIEESSSLQDTIYCFSTAKIVVFERWRSFN